MSSISELLKKSSAGNGLRPEEVSLILQYLPAQDWDQILDAAEKLTERRFERKLNYFAPIYFSNYCVNDCVYCGFRRSNYEMKRKVLTETELVDEAKYLWNEGHRTLLLIAGEHPTYAGVEQISNYVKTLKRERLDFSLMVEIAPQSKADYHILKEIGVTHCLLFQETYDRFMYANIHSGIKSDYFWRLSAMQRALDSGIEHVGLGILLGVGSWQADFTNLISHAYQLKKRCGKFPATFSFPRLQPIHQARSYQGNPVSDETFKRVIALTRLACPDIGIVLTTRESPNLRRELLERNIGITHLSAGSSTTPGGYQSPASLQSSGQFNLSDCRSLREVKAEAEKLNYHSLQKIV